MGRDASCLEAEARPPGWPHLSASQQVLAPFLACTSPAEFVELQNRVDMPRLVKELEDWSAVRLGALGPVREDAAEALNRKRASFLVTSTEKYGVARAEVFALFILHSAFDDDLKQVLLLLARDKRLAETLGQMGAVREGLEQRGLKLSDHLERGEKSSDVARGLGRAARDFLSSSPLSNGAAYLELSAQRGQLPVPYQQALDAVERARYLSEDRLQMPELRLKLAEVVKHLEARLGVDAMGGLARYIQARREAGRFVAVGGVDAAAALYEARGDVPRARAWLSRAKPERVVPTSTRAGVGKSLGGAASLADEAADPTPKRAGAGKSPGDVASLVDEAVGLTREVVEARLVQVELESPGPRLSGDVAVLEKQRPSFGAPLPGAQGNPRWSEYVAYYENRIAELKQGKAVEGPLRWEAYERMRGLFARGLGFERFMVELLRADAALPRALRRFLGDFVRPRIETYVGVWKPETGLRFADVLIIEEGELAGSLPRVETFSFKSRDLKPLKRNALEAQMKADASEALRYYGETLDIRRPSLNLRDKPTQVHRVRLVYEGGALKPKDTDMLRSAVNKVKADVEGVEVLFQ
ncbi:hypothetical protein [Archangium sp.]|uniref:hypothetical protein n=1 Tax=Archangium sp. TaxID=1872627 RepID=UPI002D240A85|nr:hypothetical protein [Archangium sp.]HYO59014.1 hypothetical protein [Archangium sp.]